MQSSNANACTIIPCILRSYSSSIIQGYYGSLYLLALATHSLWVATQCKPLLLKAIASEIATPLCIISKKSLTEGNVPNYWTSANDCPIFKKGKRQCPENYRPVSLTPVVCKILEILINSRITNHLAKYNLLNKSHHGFLSKRSCLTNLLEFLEDVTKLWTTGTH